LLLSKQFLLKNPPALRPFQLTLLKVLKEEEEEEEEDEEEEDVPQAVEDDLQVAEDDPQVVPVLTQVEVEKFVAVVVTKAVEVEKSVAVEVTKAVEATKVVAVEATKVVAVTVVPGANAEMAVADMHQTEVGIGEPMTAVAEVAMDGATITDTLGETDTGVMNVVIPGETTAGTTLLAFSTLAQVLFGSTQLLSIHIQ